MASILKQMAYLPYWFIGAKFFGRRRPLQTVLFITERCNLRCKHCSVYKTENGRVMKMDEIEEHLRYAYNQGSRFLDIEGGETTLWRDGNKTVNDIVELAHRIGFFTATITTNAQQDISWVRADSLWVSMDGIGRYHDLIRGDGAFAKLERHINESGLKHLSVNMVVNTMNYESVDEAIEYVKRNPAIEMISINFHTPFPGTEYLALPPERRAEVIDRVLEYKRKGYPIMNSRSGLKKMKHVERLKNRCFVTNFIYPDGSRGLCVGYGTDICKRCGFCMAGEMASVFNLCPDTIMAGLNLRR